jgi:transcriptional regulator with XRE-family HTH domain
VTRPYAVEIGTALRELRENLNLSQAEVAAELGVATMTLGNWERGKNVPTVDDFIRVCTTLGQLASDVLRRAEVLLIQEAGDLY